MTTPCPRCASVEPQSASRPGVCPRCGSFRGDSGTTTSADPGRSVPTENVAGGADPFQTLDGPLEERLRSIWGGSIETDARNETTLRGSENPAPEPRGRFRPRPRVVRGGGTQTPSSKDFDYDLLQVVGEGGMGVVYSARQAGVDRTIAVKLLRPERASNPRAVEKFLAEAAVTGDLDHPNIVPVHELGATQDGMAFYAMKRVQGIPWSKAIKEKPLHENLEILLRVSDAVDFAHSRGVVHRDLKPENVMLGDFGEVLVMDWGLAASCGGGKADSLNRLDSAGGTPAYMAPEMASGAVEKIGPRSDVYLLGAILYEIVSGRPPHAGGSVLQCIFAAARNEIVPTHASGELVEVARKAMAAEPDRRYADVKEFKAALRSYQSHAESVRLSSLAEMQFVDACRTRSYDDFAQALYAFREATKLWKGNDSARRGAGEVRLAYAEAAHGRGDFELALSLLDESAPEHREPRKRIAAAMRERDARRTRLRNLGRVALGLGTLLLATLAGAYFWVSSARDQEVLARDAAVQSEGKARSAQQQAEESADLAWKAQKQAKDSADQARSAEAVAKDSEKRAQESAEQAKKSERDMRAALASESKALAEAKAAEKRAVEAAAREARAADETAQALVQSKRLLGRALLERGERAFMDGRFEEAVASYWKSSEAAPEKDPIRRSALRLMAATRPYVPRLLFAEGAVSAAEISRDGQYALTVSDDHAARLWDAATGAPLGLPWKHELEIAAAAFSPDSRTVATLDGHGVVRLWKIPDGRLASTHRPRPVSAALPAAPRPPGAADSAGADEEEALDASNFAYPGSKVGFSADGSRIYSTTGGVHVWDAAKSGRSLGVRIEMEEGVVKAAISPNGKVVLVADFKGNLEFRDAADGRKLASAEHPDGGVAEVGFRWDGKAAYSVGDEGRAVQFWNPSTGKVYGKPMRHSTMVLAARISPDGRMMATCDADGKVQIWDALTGDPSGEPLRHDGPVGFAEFSPDGRTVSTLGGVDFRLRRWDLETRRLVWKAPQSGHDPSTIALSDDGRRLVTSSGGLGMGSAKRAPARLIEVEPAPPGVLRLHDPIPGEAMDALASEDGRVLSMRTEAGEIRFWKLPSGEPIGRMPAQTDSPQWRARTLSPDGSVYARESVHEIHFWDVKEGRLRKAEAPPDGAQPKDGLVETPATAELVGAAFRADGKRYYFGRLDGLVHRWNVETALPEGEPLNVGAPVRLVEAFHDGRRLLVAAGDHPQGWRLEVWDAEKGVREGPPIPIDGEPWMAAIGRDDRLFAVASLDRELRFWDVASRTPTSEPILTPQELGDLVFSPDGATLATAEIEGAFQLWDAASGLRADAPWTDPHLIPELVKYLVQGGHQLEPASVPEGGSAPEPEKAPPETEKAAPETKKGASRGLIVKEVLAVSFSGDGRSAYAACRDGSVLAFPVPPPLPDEPEALRAWVEVRTGRAQSEERSRPLSAAEWFDRRSRLESAFPKFTAVDSAPAGDGR